MNEEKVEARISGVVMEMEDTKTHQLFPPSYGKDEKWVQEYIAQFGEDPSFF